MSIHATVPDRLLVVPPRRRGRGFPFQAAGPFAVVLVLATGLHGWGLAEWAGLRWLWPVNAVVLAWIACLLPGLIRSESRAALRALLPPVCVGAYLIVCLLSVAAAENPMRAAQAAAKLIFSLVGAYTLVAAACATPCRTARLLWGLAVACTGVTAHAAIQLCLGRTPTALFESPLKLGSFLAMTVPLAASFLASRGRVPHWVWAALLGTGGLAVCGSAWACFGILVGLIAGMTGTPSSRRCLAASLVAAVVALNAGPGSRTRSALASDAQWREDTGRDIRQRYIEWQALVNLLADRAGVGTGAGCLNDRRSEYYLRLPKNNTITAFDQNGYLAASAEMGLPGLIALCWVLGDSLRRAFRSRAEPVLRSAGAGLIGAAIAQIASSLTYNGIVTVFAVLLAVADSCGRRITDEPA